MKVTSDLKSGLILIVVGWEGGMDLDQECVFVCDPWLLPFISEACPQDPHGSLSLRSSHCPIPPSTLKMVLIPGDVFRPDDVFLPAGDAIPS